MRIDEINIRDPFVLVHDGKYYLYGTRGAECWGKGLGLDVYVSRDMQEFDGPTEVFTRPEGFWADRNFWAPEVHEYKGAFYMFVSFKSETECRGTQILKADTPMGPFRVHSDGPVTPRDWECLDGTFFLDKDGTPYMVFCHEWVQVGDGEICAIRLTDDLKERIGAPRLLFRASEPTWSRSIRGGENYVTDGPFLHRTESGRLLMIWSSFSEGGYCEGIAFSSDGSVSGKWEQEEELLFEADGGHGMIFRDLDGKLQFIFHQPNKTPLERPHTVALIEKDGTLVRA